MFAQPMILGGASHRKMAFAAMIASVAVIFASLFGAVFAYAQTDGGNNGTGSDGFIRNPLPDTTINLDTNNDGPNLPNTGADVAPDRSTWLILAVVVIAVALMIVGWGMGAKNGPTNVVER